MPYMGFYAVVWLAYDIIVPSERLRAPGLPMSGGFPWFGLRRLCRSCMLFYRRLPDIPAAVSLRRCRSPSGIYLTLWGYLENNVVISFIVILDFAPVSMYSRVFMSMQVVFPALSFAKRLKSARVPLPKEKALLTFSGVHVK